MSNTYKHGEKVPSEVLAARLNELADDITKGNLRQFVMRVPAELDHCPDLVLSAAAGRLNKLELVVEDLESAHLWLDDKCVPRFDQETDATHSLVGRIMRYKET